jgi:hypothetical protein
VKIQREWRVKKMVFEVSCPRVCRTIGLQRFRVDFFYRNDCRILEAFQQPSVFFVSFFWAMQKKEKIG